jgi:hypothetical protein
LGTKSNISRIEHPVIENSRLLEEEMESGILMTERKDIEWDNQEIHY